MACAVVAGQGCGPAVSSDVCDHSFDAYVSYLEKCGDLATVVPGFRLGDVADIFDARADFDAHYCDGLPRLAGTGELRSALESCTAALDAAVGACDLATIGNACSFRGTLPTGARCVTSEECASGTCVAGGPPSAATDEVCGTCARLREPGEDCSADIDVCDVGSFCDHPLGTATYVCESYAAEGATCGIPDTQCDPIELCENGICTAGKKLGEPCQNDCARNLRCQGGVCTGSSMSPQPLCGEFCSLGDVMGGPTVSCTCGPDAFCPSGEYMACVPKGKLGDACNVGDGRCAPWLVCTNGSCSRPDISLCQSP